MSPEIIGAVASGGTDLISAGINFASQQANNRATKAFAMDMYNRQKADALNMWNLQNEYNAPTAQMQRLKNAGLNPNLAYGGGATTLASQPQKPSPTSWSPSAPQLPLAGLGGKMVGTYFDIRQQNVQTDNLKKQGDLLDLQKQTEANKALALQADTMRKTWLNDKEKGLFRGMLDMQAENIRRMQANTAFTNAQNIRNESLTGLSMKEGLQRIVESQARTQNLNVDRRRIEQMISNLQKEGKLKDIDIDLRTKGFNWSDPYYIRAGIRVGEKIIDAIKNKTGEISGGYDAVRRGLNSIGIPAW